MPDGEPRPQRGHSSDVPGLGSPAAGYSAHATLQSAAAGVGACLAVRYPVLLAAVAELASCLGLASLWKEYRVAAVLALDIAALDAVAAAGFRFVVKAGHSAVTAGPMGPATHER